MRAYDYWWGYSAAQIDLMVADQPVIVYKKDVKRNADRSVRHTKKEMDELWEKWEKKKAKEGSKVGKRINLGEWMREK